MPSNTVDRLIAIIDSMTDVLSLMKTNKYIDADQVKQSCLNNEKAIIVIATQIKEVARLLDDTSHVGTLRK